MTGHEFAEQQQELEAARRAEAIITTGVEVVDLVEQIAGASLLEPTEKRDDTPLPAGTVVTRAKELAIRGALSEIGVGMTEDRDLEAAGLPEDAAVLLEWGQEHKGVAERDKLRGKGPLFFSATRLRNIPAAERALTARLFHGGEEATVGATEYDEMRGHGIPTLDGFVAFEEPVEIGHVKWDGTIGDDEEFGTLLQVGTHQDGQPVFAFDVPRKYQYHPDGQPVLDERGRHQYDQPSAAAQLVAFAQLVPFEQGAVATSSTYYPSRFVESVRASYAGIKAGLAVPQLEVVAYCPQTLADVKQETRPAVPGLAHILGEAYRTRLMLTALQAELAPPQTPEGE